MAFTFTIAASAKDLQPGWRVSEQLNGRNVMTGSVVSLDGTYRPAARAVVDFADGATTLFKGLIHDLSEGGLGGYGATPIDVAFGATDYNVYADHRQMEITIPSGGVLKDALTQIVAALSDKGVTLDGTQANGPTFTEDFALPLAPITAQLDKLSVATGYGWDISYSKVLSMAAPGTTPAGAANNAPFNIAAGNGYAIGDITVKPSLSDFANVVYVRYSSAPTTAYAFFEMTGNPNDTQTVTVGGKTYTFQTTLTNSDGNVQIDANYLITITNLHRAITLQGTPGTDYAAAMTVNAQVTAGMQSDNSIRVVALQAGEGGNSIACTETCANARWLSEGGTVVTTLKFGTDETMNLWVRSPEAAASLPAAADRVERTMEHPEIQDRETAQLMADGYLVRFLQVPNEIHYRTLTNGLHPGMKQSIVEAKRNLNSSNCLITNVELSAVGNVIWYDITAVDALVIPPGEHDLFKQWSQGSGGGGGGSSSGISITTLTIGANGLINSGATSWTAGTGFWLDYNAGTPRFRVGNPSGNQLNWDGTNLKVQSLNLTIDQNGVLIAPDATARSEDNGFRFGAGFGTYGTSTAGPDTQVLDVISDYSGFVKTARVNIRASATTDPSTASLVLQGVQSGSSSAVLTADTITLTGTLTLGSSTFPSAAGASGTFLRSNGTNWLASTLVLPNAATSGRLVYASATNTYGESANLTFDGTTFSVLASDGGFTSAGSGSNRFDRYSNTAANGAALNLRRARGTGTGSAAIVQSGDALGGIYFRGYGATINEVAASIEGWSGGTPGSGGSDMPGALTFSTSADGSATPTEAVRINASQNVGIGTGATVSARLHVISTAEVLRLGYDASNYLSATTNATGGVTITGTGTFPYVSFSVFTGFTNGVVFSGPISPTQLTANTDNWNPTGLSTANVIRINVDAARNLTGIVAPATGDGRTILLYNTTAFTVTLVHDATSTAANRFYCPGAANFSLTQKRSVWLRYDGTHSRWTIFG